MMNTHCFLYVKDTILKEFTTSVGENISKEDCFLYVKDTILKEFTTKIMVEQARQ